MLEKNTDYDNFGVEEYLLNTGLNKKDINKFLIENQDIYVLLVKIISLKQLSLMNVYDSDDENSENLKSRINIICLELVIELKEKHNYEFNDTLLG